MKIYRIDGFTAVNGDHAYVEADDEQAARDALAAALREDPHLDTLQPEVWTVREVMRPLVAIVWRD